MIESLDNQDTLQMEYWNQIARKALGLEMEKENNLSIRSLTSELENISESQWVIEFDENIYGYYIYFIRLSNKQASLSVDRKGWVKTPIFLRRSINSGIYLDVTNVPPGALTSIRISGMIFLTEMPEEPEELGDCESCCHRVDSSMTSQKGVTCSLPTCDYEPVEFLKGRFEKEL